MQNKKQKIVILLGLVLLANFMFANFALGQTPPTSVASVSKVDIVNIQKLQQNLRSSRRSSIFAQQRLSVMSVCKALGDKLLQATGNTSGTSFTTYWSDLSLSCGFGTYLGTGTGNDPIGKELNRNYIVQANDPEGDKLYYNIYNGTTLDAAQFQKKSNSIIASVSSTSLDPIIAAMNVVLSTIANVITSVLLAIASLAGMILNFSIDQANTMTQPDLVLTGWTIVRDLMNMVFILALIVMALATILNVGEEYNYKRLLPKLIIMALLINFSKVIAETLIDFSNFITHIFVPASGFVSYGETFFHGFIGQGNGVIGFFTSSTGGGFQALGEGILKIIGALVVTASFLAIAGLLFIRLVGLWVLTIISPVAYALSILPATEHYAQEWWQTFIKYLVWAPVAVFFLRLGELLIAAKGGSGGSLTTNSMFDFIFISAFMWAGVLVAEKAGMVGGDMIINGVKSGVFGGAKALGGGALGLIGRSYTKAVSKKLEAAEGAGKGGQAAFWRAAQFANLRVAKEAWEQRSKEKEEEAYLPALGYTHDTLNRVMPTEWHGWGKALKGGLKLGQRTYYGRIGQRQLFAHKKKLIEEAGLGEEDKVKAYNNATHPEDQVAWMSALQSGRHEDGQMILTALEARDKRAKMLEAQFLAAGEAPDAAWAKANHQATEEIPAEFDAVDYMDVLTDRLQHEGLNSEQIGDRMSLLAEQAEAEQKIRGLGMEVYEYDNKYRAANDLTGYAKMEKELGSARMLDALKDTGVFKDADIQEEEVKDAAGNVVGKKVVKLKFDGKEITDYASLQTAIQATIGKTAQEKIERRKQQTDLRYEIVGARKNTSADKRMMRGDSERWARAMEPAAYMVQNDQGDFTRFTSFGSRRFANISAATVSTFRKTRGVQARVLKMGGIYKDEQTGKIDITKFNYDVMSQALEMNEEMGTAIINKASLDEDTLRAVYGKLKAVNPGLRLSEVDFLREVKKKD